MRIWHAGSEVWCRAPRQTMTDWRSQAACKDVGPDIFFPTSDKANAYDRARAICAQCSVRADCLDYGMSIQTRHFGFGMWGGLSPLERRGMGVRRMVRSKTCEWCGQTFTYSSEKARTCSTSCRNRAYEARRAS
jgi:hypothetical protein